MANLFGRFLGREGIWLDYCFRQRGCDQRTDTLSEQSRLVNFFVTIRSCDSKLITPASIFSEYWCADRLTGWLNGSVVYDCVVCDCSVRLLLVAENNH